MRILLVEDDKDLQRLLKKALGDAGYVVDAALDGEEGHFLGDTEPYDAVILDLGLPKMDGVAVLEKWRASGKTMPVLILTARDRWSDKVAGFDAGADDYLAKPFYTEELLARLRALLRRAAGIATADIEIGKLRIDTRASRVTFDGNPVKLTSQEYRLLAYLAHHRGKVVSRTELVEHLYDQDFDRDFQHDRGLHRPPAQETGRRPDSDGARAWLFAGRSQTGRHGGFRLESLSSRLIAAAAVWTLLGLVVGGAVLSNAFRLAAQTNFDAALAGRHGRADRRRRARSRRRGDAGRPFPQSPVRPRLFRPLLPDPRRARAAGRFRARCSTRKSIPPMKSARAR